MKIIYIQDYGDVGGATKSLKEMIYNLHKNYNIEPIIITSDYNSVNEFANENCFENYAVNHKAFLISPGSKTYKKIIKKLLLPLLKIEHYFFNKKALKKLEKSIDFQKIDIIHTNVNRNDIGAMISKKYNIPHIWHIREFGDLDYEIITLKKNYIKYMNDNTTKFIAISKSVAEHWISKGIDEKKVNIIYNGIDTSNINFVEEKNLNNKINIIFTGFLTKNKGQIQAIEALNLMKEEYKKRIHIDFYGIGNEEYIKYLKNKIKQYNLENNISFMGYNKNMMQQIKKYDIGLTCSKSEGFGRITIENMVNGVCAIASNTGANPEIIENEEDGLLYEYGNPTDLKNKIEKLITNEKLYLKIRKNGYKKVIQKFTSNINCKNIYNIYESIKK